MEGKDILVLGAVAVGGYLLYQNMQSQPATATATPGGTPVTPPPATPGGTGNPLQGSTTNQQVQSGPKVSPTQNIATQIQLANITRPGSTYFVVGDNYQITVSGPPNSPVTALGIHNGNVPSSPASFGQTDSNGKLNIGGVMDASTVGNWQETWQVGGASPVTISFTVFSGPPATLTMPPF